MPQVELTSSDIKNLLAIVNSTTIKGESAESIVELKRKLSVADAPLPEPKEK